MSTPYDQKIEELLAQYREQRDESAETRRRINEVSATVTAPRQAVKVTVGAQGQISAIEFPTGAYRRMAPKELADLLITTIQEARAKALEQVGEVVSTELPEGVTMSDLLQGRVQPAAVLTEEPAMPASVREYIDHGHSGV
ncbi:YbaB/EbfC family nucleoid-associated protein [Streptomyces sp. NBC_01450]|uniref:YbaB/EbfC family nucleoid-associated protein n=1 Tax=Streptomyces sp. NBC_01450 TaxID=2903871 RepID=UPI002E3373C4|nr:YbaB/EbfC family nucleoid-associated protein [Streptomyces sp. NBC_01450]